jgi:primosomal protein N' (replication factor Y)
MVAKGLDLPSVTLVGIISADTSLHLPDFRAGERTFQLLCQVAGRAGRGATPGRVIVQTFSPGHYAIAAGARHDYAAFYQQEVEYRRQHDNPPFSQLVCLIYHHTNANACQQEAEKLSRQLKWERDSQGLDINLIGPFPMFFYKVRGNFRWQIILRGSKPARLIAERHFPQGWTIDIDPISLL